MQDKLISFLYKTTIGRVLLKVLTLPVLSELAGKILDTKFSTILIEPFKKSADIDMEEYVEREYTSFNDFFTRRVKEGKRIVDMTPENLVSPCDSALTVYEINPNGVFSIKGSNYTVETLLRNSKLAERYEGGYAAVFRLGVSDYHRYSYIDNGYISRRVRIPGKLHTVMPIANDYYPIYHENTREYSQLKSENFGRVIMMEVGALLVGRIVNYHEKIYVIRGEEKGRFEYGGSTVVCLFEKDKVKFNNDIMINSANGIETKVRLGEQIGQAY